jgi:Fe-S oxidoreductase
MRINDLRLDEIVALDPDLAATACPFCLIMLEEALGSREKQGSIGLVDIAERIATALQPDTGPDPAVDSGAA